MTMIRTNLPRLVALAGALTLSALCLGAALAPAQVATIAARA